MKNFEKRRQNTQRNFLNSLRKSPHITQIVSIQMKRIILELTFEFIFLQLFINFLQEYSFWLSFHIRLHVCCHWSKKHCMYEFKEYSSSSGYYKDKKLIFVHLNNFFHAAGFSFLGGTIATG